LKRERMDQRRECRLRPEYAERRSQRGNGCRRTSWPRQLWRARLRHGAWASINARWIRDTSSFAVASAARRQCARAGDMAYEVGTYTVVPCALSARRRPHKGAGRSSAGRAAARGEADARSTATYLERQLLRRLVAQTRPSLQAAISPSRMTFSMLRAAKGLGLPTNFSLRFSIDHREPDCISGAMVTSITVRLPRGTSVYGQVVWFCQV
jgi:hypothetical protein